MSRANMVYLGSIKMAHNSSTIAANIRKLRGLRGLTQKQLAKKLGVKYQHIGRWERGVKPTARNLAKLASALKVDVSELTAPPPVSDRREIIGAQTTLDIDTAEARQRRLLEETIVAALVKDPRLRLMDEHLEEIVRYIRSQADVMGEIKDKLSQLNSLLEQVIKSQQKEGEKKK